MKHCQSDGNGGLHITKVFATVVTLLLLAGGVFAGLVSSFVSAQSDISYVQDTQEDLIPQIDQNTQGLTAVERDISNINARTERIENKLDRLIEKNIG